MKPPSLARMFTFGTFGYSLLFRNVAGGLHHLCFKCNNLDGELARLNALGARTISLPEPGEAFENENIAFVFAKGINVELIDTDKKTKKNSDNYNQWPSVRISQSTDLTLQFLKVVLK